MITREHFESHTTSNQSKPYSKNKNLQRNKLEAQEQDIVEKSLSGGGAERDSRISIQKKKTQLPGISERYAYWPAAGVRWGIGENYI